MKLHSISLLNIAEAEIANRIRALLKELKFSGRLVFKTQPTTFINPKWAIDLPADLQQALFTGVILFSIVKGLKQSRLAFAIIDRDSPAAELVVELLHRFKINVCLCDINAGFPPVEASMRGILEIGRPLLVSKPITNQYERWLLSITDIGLNRRATERMKSKIPSQLRNEFENCWAMNRRKYLVFHEVALPAFIHFELSKTDQEIDLNFALASRVDILVTGESPDYVPLLVIEFDGPHHRTAAGENRDKKKEVILRKAGIPLLRVGFEDAPPPDSKINVIDFSARRNAIAKERFLIQLIGSITRKFQRNRVDYPQRWRSYVDKLIKQYKTSEEQLLTESGHIALPEDVLMQLRNNAVRNSEHHQQEVIDDIALDEYMEREFRKDLLDPIRRTELKNNGVQILDITWIEDGECGIYCQANLVKADVTQLIRTPSVHFKCIGFNEIDRTTLKEELQIWLINSVVCSLETKE